MRSRTGHRAGDDRGVSLVIIAITIAALLGVGGLAIDGGRAYALRRQMQNAADAGALDATKVLEQVQRGVGTAPDVRTAALTRVAANGGTMSTCKLVPFGWVPSNGFSSTIDCPASGTTISTTYRGVYVQATQSQTTFLVQVVGASNFTADATATAQYGKPAYVGPGPFAMCGAQLNIGGSTPLMLKVPGTNSYYVNPAAVGLHYYVYGAQQHKQPGANCGMGSQWKGVLAWPGSYTLGGDDWQTVNGTASGPVRKLENDPNACGSSVVIGCSLVLPMCPSASPLGGGKLTCTELGRFLVVASSGSSITDAIFQGAVTIATPGGIIGPPDDNGARRVALTD